MKRILTVLFLVSVCAAAWAVQIETGTNGQKVSTVNPLPVEIMSGTGVALTMPSPWTTYQCTSLVASTNVVLATPLTGRKFIALCSLATTTSIWINPGGTAATVSMGIEIPPGGYWADNLSDAVSVPYIASVSVPMTKVEAK